jgi:hypothetical protein
VRGDGERLPERVEDALGKGDEGRGAAVLAGPEDGELVTPEPSQRVGFREVDAETVGDRLEERVADAVPELVVHGLEPVEVDEQQRGVFAPCLVAMDGPELLEEERAVGEAGQGIMACEEAEVGERVLALGHVLVDGHPAPLGKVLLEGAEIAPVLDPLDVGGVGLLRVGDQFEAVLDVLLRVVAG